MGEAMEELARALTEKSRSEEALVLGRVLSAQPLRVLCEGNAQDGDALLVNPDLTEKLERGDRVVLWPMEERQRYAVVCKVVEL